MCGSTTFCHAYILFLYTDCKKYIYIRNIGSFLHCMTNDFLSCEPFLNCFGYYFKKRQQNSELPSALICMLLATIHMSGKVENSLLHTSPKVLAK